MSIVVAVQHDGMTAIASDSLVSYGDETRVRGPKYVEYGTMLIGVVGHSADVQALQALKDEKGVWYAHDEADIRTALRSAQAQVWEETHPMYPPTEVVWRPTMVAATKLGAAMVDRLGAVSFSNVEAAGSGSSYAMGAYHALLEYGVRHQLVISASEIAEAMVHAAIRSDPSCGGPVLCTTVETRL